MGLGFFRHRGAHGSCTGRGAKTAETALSETIAEMVARHADGGRVVDTIEAVYAGIEAYADPALFIALRPKSEALAAAAKLDAEGARGRPEKACGRVVAATSLAIHAPH